MKTASRIAQSLVLLLSTPVLMVIGIATYSLVMLGQTASAIAKVWK